MTYAIKDRLQRWEYENQLRLEKLSTQFQSFTKQSLLRAARLTSFLLYLAYGGGKLSVAIARGLIVGPELIRHVSPNERPLERHEFDQGRFNSFFKM